MPDTPQTAIETFVVKAMRGNFIETWQSAGELAEWCATDIEAGNMPLMDGPEACRQMAEAFRQIANALAEKK